MDDPIESQIGTRLTQVHQKIASACQRCGRQAKEVVLVGVSKRQPVAKIRAAVQCGLKVLGENQVQEAVAKSQELPVDLDWQLIGPLQSNKVKPAARLFSTIHSLDRLKIARLLDKEAKRLSRRLKVFIQINIGAESTKHGFLVHELPETLDVVRTLDALEVVGLMAIPPYEEDLGQARQWFQRLRQIREDMWQQPEWGDFPGFLSMGMSHDFEIAIEEGATHVRLGTKIFGPRDT